MRIPVWGTEERGGDDTEGTLLRFLLGQLALNALHQFRRQRLHPLDELRKLRLGLFGFFLALWHESKNNSSALGILNE